MAVPTSIADLSVSEGSNSPLDADSVTATTRPSDYLRAHGAIIRTLAASSTLAAAGTTDLSTVTGTFITLTGAAATITALGTLAAGLYKHVIYNAAHTLTHNGTSLILLGGANRTVAAGDISLFVSEGSGNWRELMFSDATGYQPLDAQLTTLAGITAQQATDLAAVSTFMGTVLDDADAATARATLGALADVAASTVVAGKVELATAAETQAKTDGDRAVTPLSLASLLPVAWVSFDGTTNTAGNCTISASYNVATVADNGTGDYTINFTSALADANYAIAGWAYGDGVIISGNGANAPTSAACRIRSRGHEGTYTDSAKITVIIFR